MKHVSKTLCALLWLLSACKPNHDTKLHVGPGLKIYQQTCASCHQLDGKGLSNAFPPLKGSDWVLKEKGRIIRIVLHGFEGEILRNNQPFNQSMASWGHLSNQEIADVLTFIRKSWGNNASEISLDEVALIRKFTEQRAKPWTETELMLPENRTIPNVSQLLVSKNP